MFRRSLIYIVFFALVAGGVVTACHADSGERESTKRFDAFLERTPPNESPLLHGVLLVIVLPLLLSGVIAWPAGAFRRRNDEPVFSQQHLPGAAKWTAWMASLVLLLFCIGFALTFSNLQETDNGLPAHMLALLCLPLIGAALTYVAVLFGLLFCVRRIASLGARMHYLAVVTACAVIVWQLHTWNLLGFQY